MKEQLKKYWDIKAKDKNTADLLLYGEISDTKWFDDDITPKQLKEDLDKAGDIKQLNIYINSPGGNVFAGQAIHSILKRHPASKTAYIDGVAASIASVIALAADKVVMPKNTLFMIHKPWSFAMGNADDMLKAAEVLDRAESSILAVYKEKTGLDEAVIKEYMRAETWFTPQEAKDAGFVDEIDEENLVAASITGREYTAGALKIDVSQFKNFPTVRVKKVVEIENRPQTPSIKAVTADDIKNFLKEQETL
jgi:ATP-dependent Clp protease protease subunit